MSYDVFNREERYLCSHLFRLLHEPTDGFQPLRRFLRVDQVGEFKIFSEVALIRDAYHHRRTEAVAFMDALVAAVGAQERISRCSLYSQLADDLKTPSLTHPQDIRRKGRGRLTPEECQVYGNIQACFKAKPDLAICVEDRLVVYEAKFTLDFDSAQLRRTKQIADLWARLLYSDLGYVRPPSVEVRTLGMEKYRPNTSWEDVAAIANDIYPEGDRTRSALAHAVALAG